MIAKTQAKVEQFMMKQQLRQLLWTRATFSKDDKASKETIETLDREIQGTRAFLESNKLNLPLSKKARHRESVKA